MGDNTQQRGRKESEALRNIQRKIVNARRVGVSLRVCACVCWCVCVSSKNATEVVSRKKKKEENKKTQNGTETYCEIRATEKAIHQRGFWSFWGFLPKGIKEHERTQKRRAEKEERSLFLAF